MNNLALSIPENQHNSPFDAIRGYRADGSEYWTARELLKWLGYKSWQFGEKAILRTIKSLENQGFNATEHVMQVHKLSNQNNNKVVEITDYELSRLACYTVAMNADPEKEMVALAQGYFAAKTREAELAKQEPMSLMQMIASQALAIDAQNKQIELIKQQQALEAARIDELTQLTHQHDNEIDRIYSPNGHYFSVIGYARNRGLKVGIETAKDIGRKCSAYCKGNGIKIEKLNDPRFGSVGSYPESVIELYI